MSVSKLLPRYNYDNYAQWEGAWELIEGMPVSMAPAPMRIHQNIANQLLLELNRSYEELDCSDCEITFEVDWKLSDDTVLRPDIVFVCDDYHEKYLTKAPKIIIEIISPSTAKNDEKVKFSIYEDEKVEYYILVYPDLLVAKVYKIKDDRYTKVGDYSSEKLDFSSIGCDLSLDFEKVFKRFRKK
jgi:Uma2 family endonuclease